VYRTVPPSLLKEADQYEACGVLPLLAQEALFKKGHRTKLIAKGLKSSNCYRFYVSTLSVALEVAVPLGCRTLRSLHVEKNSLSLSSLKRYTTTQFYDRNSFSIMKNIYMY
jgi:hypothetical protein